MEDYNVYYVSDVGAAARRGARAGPPGPSQFRSRSRTPPGPLRVFPVSPPGSAVPEVVVHGVPDWIYEGGRSRCCRTWRQKFAKLAAVLPRLAKCLRKIGEFGQLFWPINVPWQDRWECTRRLLEKLLTCERFKKIPQILLYQSIFNFGNIYFGIFFHYVKLFKDNPISKLRLFLERCSILSSFPLLHYKNHSAELKSGMKDGGT